MKTLNEDTKLISIREYIYKKNHFFGFLFAIIFLLPFVSYYFLNSIIPDFWVFCGFLHHLSCLTISIYFNCLIMKYEIIDDKEEKDYYFTATCYNCEKEYELYIKKEIIRKRKKKIIKLNEANKESK